MRLVTVLRTLVLASLFGSAEVAAREPMGSAPHLAPGYLKCLLSRYPEFVGNWLGTLPGTGVEAKLLNKNQEGIDTCFGINSDGSRFFAAYDYQGIRAGIIRYLLQSRRADLTEQMPAVLDGDGGYHSVGNDVSVDEKSAMVGADVSRCLVRSDWQSARSIVLAVDPKMEGRAYLPKTVEKREIALVDTYLDRFIRLMPACLPVGFKIRLNRLKLRRLLEEAVFHATNDRRLSNTGAAMSWRG